MKILSILIFLLPVAAAGQSTNDYEKALSNIQKFYNAGQGDSINALFGHVPDDIKSSRPLWTNESNRELLAELGTLKSFRYIGIDKSDPNEVYVFETIFSKAGVKTTSLTLYKDLSVGTFRLITTSDSIDDLLQKSKGGR
ncbi:MAG: hypothetical protein JNM88_05545 [Chitinophagaceae bacterium]|nr:hypothetical protein [Chitinophagaceae bacterium]